MIGYSSMGFQRLADGVVRTFDQEGLTPVLVLDRRVVLSTQFFAELIGAIHRSAGRHIRLEVLLNSQGLMGLLRAKQTDRLIYRLRQAIPEAMASDVSVECRTVLSRAGGPSRPLTVGLALDQDSLPEWASSLRLTFRPRQAGDIQLELSYG